MDMDWLSQTRYEKKDFDVGELLTSCDRQTKALCEICHLEAS